MPCPCLGLEALFIGYMAYLALKPAPVSTEPSKLEETVEAAPMHQFLLYEDSAHPFYLNPYKE